jgi:hypothetical protein
MTQFPNLVTLFEKNAQSGAQLIFAENNGLLLTRKK